MKNTKIMLAVIAITVTVWLVVGLAGCLISYDSTYAECLRHGATFMIMLTVGWVPGVILAYDLDKTL
jgi:uncharacterized membrane protein YqaE (UPF0057 family)